MKKTILILGGVLLAVFIVLNILDRDRQYAAEKAIYKLNVQYNAYSKDPASIPDRQYQSILDGYNKFIKHYPHKRLAALAYTLRGRMMALRKDYPGAEKEFDRLIAAFADNPAIQVRTYIEKAETCSIAKDKKCLLDTYHTLVKKYPLTREGMNAPLVVAAYFMKENDTEMAARSYVDAIEQYEDLIKKYPDSQVEFEARNLLGSAYIALHKWDKARQVYADVILNFANPQFWNKETFLKVTRAINTISVFELNDLDYPAQLYQKFIDKYPKHPFNNDYKKLIALMKEYKKYHDQEQATMKAAESKTGLSAETSTVKPMPQAVKEGLGSPEDMHNIANAPAAEMKAAQEKSIQTMEQTGTLQK